MLQLPLWDFPVDWVKAARPDWIKPGTRVVNNLRLGQALNGEMKLDPPIKSMFVFCTNPVSQSPETNKIVEGLKREDLFTVVAEHFITDTAKYADIILPSAMAGEAEDMMWSWGHFYFTYNEKAVEPPGECKPTSEMWRLLAKEMGFDDPVFKMTDSELVRRLHQLGRPEDGRHRHGVLQGARLLPHRCRRRRHAHPARRRQVPNAVRQGRAALARREELRRSAVPCHVRGRAGWLRRSTRCPATCQCANRRRPTRIWRSVYPLNIISPKSHGFLNSCYANEPHKIRGQGEQFVIISPADAATRNIREGDPVRVQNARGDFEGVARVSDDVNPGIVVATLGYWRSLNRSDGSVNSISSDAWWGLGRAPTFSDNLVEVTRVN